MHGPGVPSLDQLTVFLTVVETGSFAAAGGLHLRCRIADVARPIVLCAVASLITGFFWELWNHGSVIRSWLMELAADAFKREGTNLDQIKAALIAAGASVRSTALVGGHATRYTVPS